jgi:hypothetical protein
MEIVSNSLGDFSGGDTPGSIPNPVVKPASADGTWGVAPWESRSLPREFFFVCAFCGIVLKLLHRHFGASPSGKAAAFGAAIRGFESSRPSF